MANLNAIGMDYLGRSLDGLEADVERTLQELFSLRNEVETHRKSLTETADYLEALGDAITLMPPEMRDPRDLADEIREMLS